MSDTGFDGQGITAGTELILSLPARFRPRPCSPRPGGECHHRHWKSIPLSRSQKYINKLIYYHDNFFVALEEQIESLVNQFGAILAGSVLLFCH